MKILIVDDDKNICRALSLSLSGTKCQLTIANSAEEAIEILKGERVDVVLTDFKMHGKTGLDLIKEVKEIYPEMVMVVMTAYASIENVIAVMREGAYDYLPKPFTNDQFFHFLNRIQNLVELKRENKRLKRPYVRQDFFSGLTSPASTALAEFVKRMALTEATLLFTGESGTGKSELAKLVHELSPRARSPFITVFCTTLNESLFESELFGHVKGSFAGAIADKTGQLQAAEQGTLFLDEVGELSLTGQAKLLRFLQDKVFQKVGGNDEITVNTRIIAATNKDLIASVHEGRFREDLYYRLNTFEFTLVSLRHRKEEVPIYIERFLKDFQRLENLNKVPIIPQAVMQKLLAYAWPGNLRELKNTIQRLLMLAHDREMTIADLPPAFRQEPKHVPGLEINKSLEEIEKGHILAVLEQESNLERASDLLGITKATLWRKRKQYGLI